MARRFDPWLAAAKTRVAITHLQTFLYGDANQMFDAEKAARD